MKTTVFLAVLLGSTAALAATPLSQSQCQSLWQQAQGSQQNESSLTQAQVSKYISDSNFKQVDRNNDGQISQSEFMTGCTSGYVQPQSAGN